MCTFTVALNCSLTLLHSDINMVNSSLQVSQANAAWILGNLTARGPACDLNVACQKCKALATQLYGLVNVSAAQVLGGSGMTGLFDDVTCVSLNGKCVWRQAS